MKKISKQGVLIGKLEPNAAKAMKRLKAKHPAVRQDCVVYLEMLLYGPKGLVTEVQALFDGSKLEVQWGDEGGGSAPPKRMSESERLREEEEALREVMKSSTGSGDEFGGGMDDLFEGGVEHDAMEEADAMASVSTTLMLHQRKALHWMLARERPSKPIFWEPYFSTRDNRRGWFNTVTRAFSREPPEASRGGLLADDMGLGKTLAVIALVMQGVEERRAMMGVGKVSSANMTGPTLVVSPLTVLQQWVDQFAKHTDGSARLYVYHGPGRTKHPLSLMLYDVVLTTYSTLGSEFVPEGKRALDDA
ncbi:SNF2 family N-terminal domain-containing protein, partial [Baffinella frigidus]